MTKLTSWTFEQSGLNIAKILQAIWKKKNNMVLEKIYLKEKNMK